MKSNDIEIGKCYTIEIWEGEINFLKCIDYDGEYYVMESPDIEYGMLIWGDDEELDYLKEIPAKRYQIHCIGNAIEKVLIEEVKKL